MSSTSRKTSFSSSLIDVRCTAEYQLQFPISMALTVVHYTCTARQEDLVDARRSSVGDKSQ